MVDFSVAPLSLAKERLVAYDVTVPLGTANFVTIFRHPKNSNTRNIFLLPFQNVVWIALLVILALASVVLLVAFRVERRSDAICNCQFLLAILGFLCQQAYSGRTSAISSRITIKAVIVFSVIIYQFYSTFIIGYLLVLPPKSIRTTKQLLGSDLKYSIEDLTYNHDFFNRTKDATALELYSRKILPNNCSFSESFDEHQICELQEISLYPSRPLYVPVPKGSPLKEIFRVSLRRMLETSVAGYFKRIFFPSKPQCMKKDFAFVQVSFGDIASLYWLLAVGAIFGIAVLLVEVVEFRIRRYLEMRHFLRQYPVWLD
ncbi:ionotropic receptor 75a-like [Ochlerotatus camptorhynchus]|uniref:ionotropic receptor 75a-like n=1 Tax=Ochlerotatus camptorhynchus TaxID=644619 RepID=UPI0031D00EE1